MAIKIIRPTSGLNTSDLVLDLVRQNPRGITVKQLSDRLNRPVSMINHYLKILVASQHIRARKENNQWVYFQRIDNLETAGNRK
ncbi:winged helix-turn-helix transcriptional regulator [Pannus brasiliensis CCIBt3594]|uniref:Winged helix-turn-helix transcriptional regulator n=1 Tax=Pannus brasiliensis CCIBt3594 TaxID=1427578 RepID=A0AAW9QQ52_9CHRO